MNSVSRQGDVPTTMGTWVQAIVRALDGHGINGSELALQAGISPRVVRNGDERAPQPAVTRLWQLAIEATGDPCFGLQVPRFLSPVTFHALGYAVLASPNLKAALVRMIRFQRLISDATEQRLDVAGDRYRFVIRRLSPLGPPDEAIDAFLCVGARTFRVLSGEVRLDPLALILRRPEPQPSDLFHKIFRCPVTFAGDEDALVYARKDVEAPLPYGNAELARQNDDIIAEYLARTGRTGSLAERVHALVVERLPDGGPTEVDIARLLCFTTRTLQIKLGQEGTSYKAIVNDAREKLAREYLRQGRYSIKEVAFLLGFADAATFTRAFRRWTGQSPGRFAAAATDD